MTAGEVGRTRGTRVLDLHSCLGLSLLLMTVISLKYAVLPPVAGNDRSADAAVAVIALLFAIVAAWPGRRLPALLGVDLPLVVAWGSADFMAATRPLPQGQLLFGFPLVALAVFAASFLSRTRMSAHIAGMFLGYLVATVATGDQLAPFYVGAASLTGLVTAGAIRHLRTSRDRLLADLARQAVLDPLTGALNRRGLELEAPRARSIAARQGESTTLVEIDLDDFKQYNDAHGHAAGDTLLAGVVTEWRRHLRVGDLIARIGGDEFVLVLPGASGPDAEQLLARMRASSAAAWSAGWSPWDEGQDLEQALTLADRAMYRSKGRGAPDPEPAEPPVVQLSVKQVSLQDGIVTLPRGQGSVPPR